MPIFMDIHEPYSIWELLTQSVEVQQLSLNHLDPCIADYLWYAADGHRIQVERKQIDEILSGMDSVEEQLSRELQNGVEETILLIERFCKPVVGNRSACISYNEPNERLAALSKKVLKTDEVMVPGHTYNVSYTGFQAWLNRLDKCGVTIVRTFNWRATATTLAALYLNSQNLNHKTLKRYIKPKIHVESKNPHIISLMGIKGAGVGEETAKSLIENFGTMWWTLNQSPETLAEVMIGDKKQRRLGPVLARKLLNAVGRKYE